MAFEVIGISGKAGSGKDHISQHILAPLGYHQFSLAWHFKVWLVGKGDATYEEVFITKPPHVRKMLQLEGTEYGRDKYGENVWCNTMGTWMRVLHDNMGIEKFVVPDVRFPNEVNFVKGLGGKVLRIDAPLRVSRNTLNAEARMHVSETALDDYKHFDGIVYNDPKHAETIISQVHSLIGEPMPHDGSLWNSLHNFFDNLFD